MSYRKHFGKWGEDFAAEYLIQQGYSILGRNVRTPYGEIDLIAKDGDGLVFIEVKTRSSHEYGFPEEAISKQKIGHMLASAQAYLENELHWIGDWRWDVLAIQKQLNQDKVEVLHFKNVIHDT